jgi:hypothetical protein
VKNVIIHPGYKPVPRELQSGDAAALMRFMEDRDDIALIELQSQVNDVAPVAIYRGSDEVGKTAEIIARGACRTT